MKSEKRDSKESSSGMDGDSNVSSKFCDFDDDDEYECSGIDIPSDGEHSSIDSLPNSPPSSPPQSQSSMILNNSDKEKRRRSTTWQAKLDRRRRKTSSNPDDEDAAEPPVNYHRQKRHSWWNILVPDNIIHR